MQRKHNKAVAIIDKIAGLESYQFRKDENRFASMSEPKDYANLPRQPRIGNNSRNSSDAVFTSASALGYPRDSLRFDPTPVVTREKLRQDSKREKLEDRIHIKRFCPTL
jgi:hypothetical protein